MRRVVLICFGVVSCASPDVRPVDGVPEDPGHHPPTLPFNPEPGSLAPPNSADHPSAPDTNDGARSQSDAGSAVGVTPVPTQPASTTADESGPTNDTWASESGGDVSFDASGIASPCHDGGSDGGVDRDAGSSKGDCRGE